MTASRTTDAELIAAATEAIDRTSDGENHTVASAIRTAGGGIVTGVNLYHFTGGPCAELVALANAAATGATVETIVAIGSDGRGVLAPCGRCRQVIADYWPDAVVLMPGEPDGTPVATPIADLLPGRYIVPGSEPV